MKKILAIVLVLFMALPAAAETIASIDVTPSWIYLYNPQGKKYKSLSTSSVGQIAGYSSTFFVSKKSSWYYLYDADGKQYKTLSVSSVGEVLGVAGDTFTSRSGSWIYTWSKDGRRLNSRAAH